jgi:RNA polymerase sigma-70 factor (ECF subfamily)
MHARETNSHDQGKPRYIRRNRNDMPRVPKVEPLGLPAGSAGPKPPSGKAPGAVDDRELVRRAQGEDQEAFEELLRRHQHRVFAVAGGILRRREDVEDIAQQVFVKAYFSLKRFDQRAAFSTWLYKITVNECWDLLRKKKVRPLVYESDLSEEQAKQVIAAEGKNTSGPDISDRLEARERVERLMEGLDERDRLMLILKEVEGFAVEEIAQVLDLNANTVKVRLFRARRRIVNKVRKRGED